MKKYFISWNMASFICAFVNIKLAYMKLIENVLHVLDSALSLNGRAQNFGRDTALMGSLPELDSMAALNLITGIESHFGLTFRDEDLSESAFATVGSLCDLVAQALSQQDT